MISGHRAMDSKTGGFLLRESAQCPEKDEKAFQDASKYTNLNTNNFWINIQAVREFLSTRRTTVPFPCRL